MYTGSVSPNKLGVQANQEQPPQPEPSEHSKPNHWYQQSTEQVLRSLGSAPEGLSQTEAAKRLREHGRNELVERASKSPLRLLWEQITEPLVVILLLAALLSALLGKSQEFIAIMAIVVLNAALGVFQEYRAEKAIAALKKMAAPLVQVRRGGQVSAVPAAEVVPGDVIVLEAGNIVPADARILEAHNLRIQEASLTGESYPVDKTSAVLAGADLPLGDRRNMLYMGTSVSYGRGFGVITETGMQSELGRIADMIQSVGGERSPLQRRMGELGRVLFVAAFIVMGIAFLVGLIGGQPIQEILLSAVAIAVAVVPEGLPAVVTISLALGAQRMLRRRALIRKLPAVETLGSVTVIASDKTGTLTENRMTVRVVDVAGHTLEVSEDGQRLNNAQVLLLAASSLANDAILQGKDEVIGDPTEGAMIAAANRFGLLQKHLRNQFPRIDEVPFSSERRRMTTIHRVAPKQGMNGSALHILDDVLDTHVAFGKGAPDAMLAISSHVWEEGRIVPLTDLHRERIELANDRMASQGLRVLGVAFRPLDAAPEHSAETVEEQMVFVGLLGLVDPPRREVAEAVRVSRKAGIRPIMITGDHPLTARAIAAELGIAEAGSRVLTGRDLANMSQEALRDEVEHVAVYARVAPEHKLRIVQALQERGHIVAMTGDGVNDAPALKQADIGVAMGITGTDVAKQASDMVITDDNFATIVSATEEGRAIYDNVRRFVKYLLASNTGELFVLLMTQLVAGLTMPLTTLQILWMNLITDGIPALALGVEKSEKNAMERAPYAPNESILGRGLGRHILLIGGTLGIMSLALGYWAWSTGLEAANGAPAWNTMVFMLLTMAQMGHALGLRSHTRSLFTMNPFGNPILLGAVVLTLVLQLAAVYLPFFNELFGTNPLTLGQLLLCLVLSTVVFWVVELEKLLMRRGIFR